MMESTAWDVRFGPWPSPIAMTAVPALVITERTSAKSRLIRPVIVTRSDMPWTPWRSMSSATLNPSVSFTRWSRSRRRSFGTTINASTTSRSASTPSSASFRRRMPSKVNGSDTTPTVNAPAALALWPITPEAPVPVPPPIPAVMNTMSAPATNASISSMTLSAARIPTSGFPPAPSRAEPGLPRCNLTGASHLPSACVSVLTAMNRTPVTPASIIRLTALPPAPPTPMTRTSPPSPGDVSRPMDISGSAGARPTRADDPAPARELIGIVRWSALTAPSSPSTRSL